jgi:hypothetical protein
MILFSVLDDRRADWPPKKILKVDEPKAVDVPKGIPSDVPEVRRKRSKKSKQCR